MIEGNIQAVLQWFLSVQSRFQRGLSQGIEAELDLIIRNLQPVTPVDTGAMQRDYAIGRSASGWQLLDVAESPRGYDYPLKVFEDPLWSTQYQQLNETLNEGIDHIEANLDFVVQRMVSY